MSAVAHSGPALTFEASATDPQPAISAASAAAETRPQQVVDRWWPGAQRRLGHRSYQSVGHPAGAQADRRPTMDEVKRTYRDVETETKKNVRGIDGTDVKDAIGNAGDEVRKDVGNAGDDLRRGSLDRETEKETETTSRR
jgi:hypothetical protein